MANRYFEVNKINIRYGDIQMLWDIRFTTDKGEIVALVGSDGAGKSTMVKPYAGLIRPFQGSIRLDGHDPTRAACRTFIDHDIIPVPEGRQLFPSMTIYENLEMGTSSKAAKAAEKDAIERIYDWFPKLKNRRNQLAGALSGGGQRMPVSSRDTMGPSRLLIMDEPSLRLVPNIVDNVFSIAKEVAQESGFTIILVEQDARKVLRIVDRGYVIESGQTTTLGTAEEPLNNDEVKKACPGLQNVVGSCVPAAAETN